MAKEESVPRGTRPRRPSKSKPEVVKPLVAVSFGVILLILIVPGIRRSPFAQGIAGLLMALIVAVVIFAVFPTSVNQKLKLPTSFLSAAGFFVLLLTKIRPMVFPIVPLSGTVHFEGTSTPVVGARVLLAGSQTPVVTNTDGQFYLKDVRTDATRLEIHYNGFDTTLVVNDSSRYAVVPRFGPISTPPQSIDAARWKENKVDRCTFGQSKARTRRFELSEALPAGIEEWKSKQVSDPTLHIKIRPTSDASINVAQIDQPERSGRTNVTKDLPAWHWMVVNPPRSITARITVCVERAPATTAAPLEMTYWFEGIGRLNGETP